MANQDQISLTGIILAGGRGIRLGRNKGLAMLSGRPLIEHVIDNLNRVCQQILISSNTDQCRHYGLPVIPDIHKGKGPMAGIHACLKASANTHHFVLSVDTPFVGEEFIRFMINSRKDGLIAAPWFGSDHYEPLCAYYNREALPVMEEFFEKGNYKLPDLFGSLPFTPVSIPDEATFNHPMLFHNINTRQDLLAAENYLKQKK